RRLGLGARRLLGGSGRQFVGRSDPRRRGDAALRRRLLHAWRLGGLFLGDLGDRRAQIRGRPQWRSDFGPRFSQLHGRLLEPAGGLRIVARVKLRAVPRWPPSSRARSMLTSIGWLSAGRFWRSAKLASKVASR